MQTLSQWLNRRPKGPAPRKPLKRGGRVKPVSDRRKREGKTYSALRAKFLWEHEFCEAHTHNCTLAAVDVHHRAGRTRGNYLNVSTWLPVCRECHFWIHDHPKEARALGLLQ